MDSNCRALAWVANLHEQFNLNFCLDADGTIPQEPIEYVRKHLLTAGENIKKLYSELVGNVLPVLNFGCLDEHSRIFPRMEEDTGSPSRQISSICIDGCDQEGRVSAITSSISLPAEKTEEIATLPDFAPSVEEYKLPDNEVTSISMEAIHSCGSAECVQASEAKSSYVTELDGISSAQVSGWQNLDESLFLVDGEDELCPDSDMEANHGYYQDIETPLLNEKFIEISPRKTVFEGFDEENEAREWEKSDEDVCDSEWEMI